MAVPAISSGVPNRANLHYTIRLGERQFVRDLLVRGLEITRPHVVLDRMLIHPGDPISQGRLGETQQKLYDLGIFSKVQTALQNPDGMEEKKYVLFQLDEAARYSFNVGIGAELASMKVSEQIDALEVSAVSPYRFLAAPRILACILMMPLLTVAADFCALLMGWFANALVEPMSLHRFMESGFNGATLSTFLPPTLKTAVFGLIVGLISCYQGMTTTGGAEGVGRAATKSVVLASLFVILADVVLVKFILVVFPI